MHKADFGKVPTILKIINFMNLGIFKSGTLSNGHFHVFISSEGYNVNKGRLWNDSESISIVFEQGGQLLHDMRFKTHDACS